MEPKEVGSSEVPEQSIITSFSAQFETSRATEIGFHVPVKADKNTTPYGHWILHVISHKTKDLGSAFVMSQTRQNREDDLLRIGVKNWKRCHACVEMHQDSHNLLHVLAFKLRLERSTLASRWFNSQIRVSVDWRSCNGERSGLLWRFFVQEHIFYGFFRTC